MAYDTFVTAAVADEIKNCLVSGKVIKIHQPDRFSILIKFHTFAGNPKLLLSAHPVDARVHLTQNAKENPLKPPLFCMVLRKWLEGARLVSVTQPSLERILRLEFATHNELGDEVSCFLIAEIMGKHSNLILTDAQDKIIDAIRRYSHLVSRYREVLPGRDYVPPPPQDKLPLHANLEDFSKSLLEHSFEQNILSAFGQNVAGLSPLMAKELLLRANIEPQTPVCEMGEYEMSRILSAMHTLDQALLSLDFSPTVLESDKNALPLDLAAFDLTLWLDQKTIRFDSQQKMSDTLDYYYQKIETHALFEHVKNELRKQIKAHIKRLEKKIVIQEKDFAKSEAGNLYKEAGDLLSANLYHLKKGLSQVELSDFYHEGEPITIDLNPALTPEQNVKRYYHLYGKCKNAYHLIQKQLQENREEYDYLSSVLTMAEQSETVDALAEIRHELIQGNYIKDKASGKKKAPTPQQQPPRSTVSQDGFAILIGRNNRQNDKLTLKMATKEDIWLHTQKIPGSHVIIQAEGKPIPDSTITEAAAYAAWYSKAQSSPKVPVDYTFADQVKKPNGAKPGMVIYFNQKTLYVTPKIPDQACDQESNK